MIPLLATLAVVLVAGSFWRLRDGRLRTAPAPDAPSPGRTTPPAGLPAGSGLDEAVGPLGASATFVQFSSTFCAPCRAARHTLAQAAAGHAGVRHVELDVAEHLALVRALDVRRTPTTLVLDATGREVGRALGAPRLAAVGRVLDALAAGGPLPTGPGFATDGPSTAVPS